MEYGTDIGQIWANNRLALSQKGPSVVFDSTWILGEVLKSFVFVFKVKS